MPALPIPSVTHILYLLDTGRSPNEIAQRTGVSHSTIYRLRSRHRPEMADFRSGRPRSLNAHERRLVIRLITSGKAETAVEVAQILRNVYNKHVSAKTVRRCLRSAGMRAVSKRKRPLLLPRHRRARLDFAETYQDYTVEDWKHVIFSDETKINRFGSDGKTWVWKKDGEGLSDRLVQGTVKFGGGSIMLWGCMMWGGTGQAARINGRMDADLYVQILEEDLMASLEEHDLEVDDVIFQQDNDPKHTSRKAREWFERRGMRVLKWPAQSPDLNPIEHLWAYLKKRLGDYEEVPKGMEELWERIEAEWAGIPASVCEKLVESMPVRIQAVLKAKGGYTRY